MTAANITNLPTVAAAVPAPRLPARPQGAIIPQSMDEALRYAKVIAASGLLPKAFYDNGDPTAAAFVCIQLGAEVGLSPMASVQNICVVNGKPALYGPAQLAVCEASGLLEEFSEWMEGDGESLTAYCKVKRYGRPEKVVSFSWAEAKKAQLTGKRGPWQEYPKRMMQARARTFALRDTLPDVLLGLAYSVEELQDVERDPPRRVVEHAPDPEPPPLGDKVIPARTEEAPAKTTKPPLLVNLPDGWEPAQFPRGKKGLREALEFLTGAVVDGRPEVVGLNVALLDQIAAHIPELAGEVANLRASAAEAMAPGDDHESDDDEPDDEPDDDEPFPGDLPNKTDT